MWELSAPSVKATERSTQSEENKVWERVRDVKSSEWLHLRMSDADKDIKVFYFIVLLS